MCNDHVMSLKFHHVHIYLRHEIMLYMIMYIS